MCFSAVCFHLQRWHLDKFWTIVSVNRVCRYIAHSYNKCIYILHINIISLKEKAGHLSTVVIKEQVEIGLSLQTPIKEYNTFDKRVWDIHVHRQNKDMDMSLLMAVANYYQLAEYGVRRICFRGGSREALRDWRVLFPRSFEVWTGTGRKMKRLRGE